MYVDLGDSSMDKMTKETHPKKTSKAEQQHQITTLIMRKYLCNKKSKTITVI
jgi:hypothetical protein